MGDGKIVMKFIWVLFGSRQQNINWLNACNFVQRRLSETGKEEEEVSNEEGIRLMNVQKD